MHSLSLYTLSFLLCLLFTTIIFSLALKKRNNSIMDIAYGPTFLFAATILSYISLIEKKFDSSSILILSLIALWSIRLSLRIYARNKNKEEDFRYAAFRTLWMKKGIVYFMLRSYLQIFVLQAFIVSIILLPFTLSLDTKKLSLLSAVGVGLWLIGFFFEAVGDAELDSFIAKREKHGKKFLTTGLFALTRHPNYFGESTMWLGLAFVSWGGGAPLFVFLSPLLITFLLLFVSGIPMVEKRWRGDPEWEAYAQKTRAFLPLPK